MKIVDRIKEWFKKEKESKAQQAANKTQRKIVMAFAEKMIAKMELKSEQEGRSCFLNSRHDMQSSSWWYYKRLGQELKELQHAMKAFDRRPHPTVREAVIDECCDVANFCVAIAKNMKETK